MSSGNYICSNLCDWLRSTQGAELEQIRRKGKGKKMRTKVCFEDDDDGEMGEIKKGPWKPEEDQVLVNHVKKHGPRDWSSIRSKGLLRRTGKSCRLRWVNKLRPDLKNGVKFSAEEERTVIDLQAQFGNKWARIATYLPGRTDNDVKNFWSSRQKRLARILRTSAPPPPSPSLSSSSKPCKNTKQSQAPALHYFTSVEAPRIDSSTEEESLTKSQTCAPPHTDDSKTIKMLPVPDLIHPISLSYEHNPVQPDYTKPSAETQPQLSFPHFPQLQPDFALPLESQDFISGLEESSILDEFGHSSGSALGTAQIPIVPSFYGHDTSCQVGGKAECHLDPDCFTDDLPPIDIFDHIDPLPSPSQW